MHFVATGMEDKWTNGRASRVWVWRVRERERGRVYGWVIPLPTALLSD